MYYLIVFKHLLWIFSLILIQLTHFFSDLRSFWPLIFTKPIPNWVQFYYRVRSPVIQHFVKYPPTPLRHRLSAENAWVFTVYISEGMCKINYISGCTWNWICCIQNHELRDKCNVCIVHSDLWICRGLDECEECFPILFVCFWVISQFSDCRYGSICFLVAQQQFPVISFYISFSMGLTPYN